MCKIEMEKIKYQYQLVLTCSAGNVRATAIKHRDSKTYLSDVKVVHNLRRNEVDAVYAQVTRAVDDALVMADTSLGAVREHYTESSTAYQEAKEEHTQRTALLRAIRQELPEALESREWREQQAQERAEKEAEQRKKADHQALVVAFITSLSKEQIDDIATAPNSNGISFYDLDQVLKGEVRFTSRLMELADPDKQAELLRQTAEWREKEDRLEAKRKQQEAEQLQWIVNHGSKRLKRHVTEGIDHQGVYLSERLKLDAPGWAYYQKVDGDYDAPRNAPASAFELLDEARTRYPEATLHFWKIDDEYDEYGELAQGWKGYVAVVECPWDTEQELVFGIPEDRR